MSMADILAVRNEYRLQNWVEIIQECQESGLSNKEFCAQRGIAEKTYYYWLRKVRTAATAVMEPQLVRLEESSENDTAHMFEIRYGKTELKLPEDVDLKALAVFLNALRRHD
jgi:transposase-like protein